MPWARELKKLRSLFFVRFKMTGEPLDIVHGKKNKQKKKKKRKKKEKKKEKKRKKKKERKKGKEGMCRVFGQWTSTDCKK